MTRGLKAIREARGLSLRDLAAKTGIGVSTIGNFETGRTEISPDLLKVLAAALDSTAAELATPAPEHREPVLDYRKLRALLLGIPNSATPEDFMVAAYQSGLRHGEAHAAAVLSPATCEAAVEHWLSSPAGQACLARAIIKFARA